MALQNDYLPDFREYPFLPHNSILGLWGFCGTLGFPLLLSPLAVGLMFAARGYRFERALEQRAAALTSIAAILTYLIHCWGDIGFTEPISMFLVGSALAVGGQLAVTTGAWPTRPALADVERVA